ncbi:MAG: ArsR family transcriptional regulator [Thermofilaceae archaeon]|nr:ArsR family transcriptional regulator [Thermofilaceae archaeon]
MRGSPFIDKEAYVAKVFRSIGQEHRLRIILHLASRGSASFSDLVEELNISGGKLNFHLRKLVNSGLIKFSRKGAYELTELGKWIVAKLQEMDRVSASSGALIVDYRSLPCDVNLGDLARSIECNRNVADIEEFLNRLYLRLSKRFTSISKELLLMITEIEMCENEPKHICLPLSIKALLYKSYISKEYTSLKDIVTRDLANSYALSRLSPLLYEYQLKGLVYVKDPVFSITGSQLVALYASKGTDIVKLVARLQDESAEIMIVAEEIESDRLELLDKLVPPGKVTVVVIGGKEPLPSVNRIGLVFQTTGSWRSLPAFWLKSVNSFSPVLLSRGDKVPSISLAEVPMPEPDECYIVPLRLAVSLPSLKLEAERSGMGSQHIQERIANESVKLYERSPAHKVKAILKDTVRSMEILRPQLALTGFEAVMRMSYGIMAQPEMVNKTKSIWSKLSKELEPVEITGAMADERLYAIAKSELYNPISVFALSLKRTYAEQALLEGTVHNILKGGSVLAIKVGKYLMPEKANELITVAESYGVMRLSFHLELTRCEVCSTASVEWKRICSMCLSTNVVPLARPLDLYKPCDTIPHEVLEEYKKRPYLVP